jgi:5-methylcytosine-specific restriction endonuclease McrA
MPIKLTLPPQNYYTWRKMVLQRDDCTCQECKKPNSREAHHIKDYRDNPELRYDISNGVTLCAKCHRQTDTYGNRKKNGS